MSDSLKTIDETMAQLRQDVEGYSIPGNDEVGIDAMFTKAKAHLQRIMAAERLDERHAAVASIAKEYDTLTKENDEYFGADFKSGYYAALHDMTLDAKDREAQLEQLIAAGEEDDV